MLPATSPTTCSGGGGFPSPLAEGAGLSTGSASSQYSSPCHSTSPPRGVDGRLARGSKEPLQQHHLSQPADPSLSCTAPSWASVVRGEARPRFPLPATISASPAAVSREDFIALERGLETRFAVRYAAGRQEVSITTSLSPPLSALIAPAAQNPPRRCRCHKAVAIGSNAPLSAGLPAASAPKNPPTPPAPPPVTVPAPPPLPMATSSPASPPPAKCMCKAAKRRCEVELLRGEGEDGDLQLSPLSCLSHLHLFRHRRVRPWRLRPLHHR